MAFQKAIKMKRPIKYPSLASAEQNLGSKPIRIGAVLLSCGLRKQGSLDFMHNAAYFPHKSLWQRC